MGMFFTAKPDYTGYSAAKVGILITEKRADINAFPMKSLLQSKLFAIIVAAGEGTRMGGEIPKQYRMLAGRPVLRRSVEAFLNHPNVDGVLVVIHPDHRKHYDAAMQGLNLPEPAHGGANRQESVRLGIERLFSQGIGENNRILVHDAARCLIDHVTISRVVYALGTAQAAIPTIPVRDTLKRVESGTVSATVPRENLHQTQTPQGFDATLLCDLHALFQGRNLSDDAALAEAANIPVECVMGSDLNFKLTTKADWMHAEMLLKQPRTGMGFDVHRLVPAEGKALKLCGITIPHSHALYGHSDADVGLHALVDAMLGSIAAGDIGEHFPPSDAQWKNADSSAFVRHALGLVKAWGGGVTHADITLICEAPKIGPHKNAMRAHVAGLMELPVSAVSVKATTTEGLGFTGRGEAIAAQAVVTIHPGENHA